MISLSFWKTAKEKWILDNDPTIAATEGLVHGSGMSTADIDKLNQELNGALPDFNGATSIDDISNLMDQLGELGMEEIPFDLL